MRGDLQEECVESDPDKLYGPVAAHETIGLLLGISESEEPIVEGCDVDNAYLLGDLDIPVRIKQHNNSTQII